MKIPLQELRFNLKQIEELREKLLKHYGESHRRLKHITLVLPQYLVRFKHKGPLRILAFSDYRVHDVKLLLNLVKDSSIKPDIILYAGDDIDRFVSISNNSHTHACQECISQYNYFEELARETRYGLGAVRGNDSLLAGRYIKGKKVYNLQYIWLRVGSYLIIGLEDAPAEYGTGSYIEADYRIRLELAKNMLRRGERLIVVSHAPPYGILDSAMRFGERSIGSIALREFIEEFDKVALVICGHVHRCGGKYEKIRNVTVVNVSSHDDYYSRANIAWIVINGESINIEFWKLASPIGQVLKEMDRSQWINVFIERFGMSSTEAQLFINMYERFGDRFLEDLEDLAKLKFRYRFTWDNVFRFYNYGVKYPEQITDEIYRKVLSESKFPHNINIRLAYVRLIGERKKGLYLLKPPPFSSEDKLVVFDIEYIPGGPTVLYGFLDLSSYEIKQFWYYEQNELSNYLEQWENTVFIHWGGEDKRRLHSIKINARVVDLLWFVRFSLITEPLAAYTLKNVHDTLCTCEDHKWWDKMPYILDGFFKLAVCERVLRTGDPEDMRLLSEINKIDLLALACVVKRILKIPVITDVNQ
ncbi:MAG: metallophosphoesterase [Desulfurococcaceae archaeon]